VNDNLATVLRSTVQVFGLLGLSYIYCRRFRPDLSATMKLGMHVFVPCLAFTAILDSRIQSETVVLAAGATCLQIGVGLLLGLIALRVVGWQARRELILPIAFVNAANLPFPLLLANYGQDGLSIGVICYTVTNLTIFSIGVCILHGGGRMREAFKEPTLWATVLAGLLRLLRVHPPETTLQIPRLAGEAAVPVMLVLFGDSLARTRLATLRPAGLAAGMRYLAGGVALLLTLTLLRPHGLLRPVLILYALLPPAMINVILTQKAGRDAQAVAASVLLASLVAVGLLPVVLAFAH
jgi:malate permease and related proteins